MSTFSEIFIEIKWVRNSQISNWFSYVNSWLILVFVTTKYDECRDQSNTMKPHTASLCFEKVSYRISGLERISAIIHFNFLIL